MPFYANNFITFENDLMFKYAVEFNFTKSNMLQHESVKTKQRVKDDKTYYVPSANLLFE